RLAPRSLEGLKPLSDQGSGLEEDNGVVAGLSPAGPTTHSHANRDFPRFDEYPRFRGGAGPTCSLCREEGPLQRQFGAFCLWRPKTVSRGACEGAAGDAVRMRLRPGLRPMALQSVPRLTSFQR